jgi:hypothetical protein
VRYFEGTIGKESGGEKDDETENEHGTNAQKCNTYQGTIISEDIKSTSSTS